MRLQLFGFAILLSLSLGNAAWPAFVQHIIGPTAGYNGVEDATGHSPGFSAGTDASRPMSKPSITYAWVLREHTKSVREPSQWVQDMPSILQYCLVMDTPEELEKSKIAFNDHFRLHAIESSERIKDQMWSLTLSFQHLLYYAVVSVKSRQWIENGYINLPYQYKLQLGILHRVAGEGSLVAIRFLARTFILPRATTTLDHFDELLRNEMALLRSRTMREAATASEISALEQIIDFRNSKVEGIVLAEELINWESSTGQYQAMSLDFLKSTAMD